MSVSFYVIVLAYIFIIDLEFLIAADIILTISQPNLEEIATLTSIVGIRTVISNFLNKEISYSEKHINQLKK